MPTSAGRRRKPVLVDTSVAVALCLRDHEAHGRVVEALQDERLGLAGHAFFETYSVLTRLPQPNRRSPADVSELLHGNFPETRFLDASDTASLAGRLADLGIAGGSVYDAIVAVAAIAHGLPLASRDTRALDTYRIFDLDLRMLG